VDAKPRTGTEVLPISGTPPGVATVASTAEPPPYHNTFQQIRPGMTAREITVQTRFPDPPTEHMGEPLEDTSVLALATLYLSYLKGLVDEAEQRFGGLEAT